MKNGSFLSGNRSLVVLLMFVGIFMIRQPVMAGSYTVTYAGGTETPTGGSYTVGSVTTPSGITIPNGYGGYVTLGGATGRSSASCSGAITATMTWHQDNLADGPPASVIIMEYSSAAFGPFAGTHGFGTGSVNDGQGGTNSATNKVTCIANHTIYRVVPNPGQSFTVTCSPSASFTFVSGQASAVYATLGVVPYAVTIGLTGPVVSGSTYAALTGTKISASLSTGGSGYPVPSYSWTPPGGGAFKNFDPTATSSQRVDLGATDYTSQTLTFYDASAESISLTCSATVTAPDGTALSVTGTAPSITMLKPTATWGVDPASLPVIVNGTVTHQPTTIGFYDASATSLAYGASTTWYPVVITIPSPFTGGTGCFAQTVTPNASITRTPTGTGASTYTIKIPGPGNTWISPGTGLDSGWPYPSGFTTDSSGNITGVASSSAWTLSGNGTGSIGASGDNPHGQETTNDVDSGGSNWQSSSISNSFTTWLMYQPSGTGSVWVPLMKATWSVNGTATGGPANWVATGSYSAPSPANASDFPTWNTVIVGQQYRP